MAVVRAVLVVAAAEALARLDEAGKERRGMLSREAAVEQEIVDLGAKLRDAERSTWLDNQGRGASRPGLLFLLLPVRYAQTATSLLVLTTPPPAPPPRVRRRGGGQRGEGRRERAHAPTSRGGGPAGGNAQRRAAANGERGGARRIGARARACAGGGGGGAAAGARGRARSEVGDRASRRAGRRRVCDALEPAARPARA